MAYIRRMEYLVFGRRRRAKFLYNTNGSDDDMMINNGSIRPNSRFLQGYDDHRHYNENEFAISVLTLYVCAFVWKMFVSH